MKILYRTEATATGGRTGQASTTDGALSVALVTPKELGGPGGDGNNPEQLFAAGYAACFLGALKFVAGQRKVKIDEASTVTAAVGIGPRDDGQGFGLDVALTIALPGIKADVAQQLVDQAHVVCPYSHAT
ncbi:MAG TPA: organic hydroperoxide resistance protein, partial [Sphingopyxis sp.]|nr:organic hydroperoxide resistance protein [Sphingopyxis sp.]